MRTATMWHGDGRQGPLVVSTAAGWLLAHDGWLQRWRRARRQRSDPSATALVGRVRRRLLLPDVAGEWWRTEQRYTDLHTETCANHSNAGPANGVKFCPGDAG